MVQDALLLKLCRRTTQLAEEQPAPLQKDSSSPLPKGNQTLPPAEVSSQDTSPHCPQRCATSGMLHKAADHVLSWRTPATSHNTRDRAALYACSSQPANPSAPWLKGQTLCCENAPTGAKHVPRNGRKAACNSSLVGSKTSDAQTHFHFRQLS